LAGCSGDDESTVVVRPVGRATVLEVVEAPATVVPRASATVTAPAPGTVAEVLVKDGQQVNTGTVLLRLDSPSARANLRQAEQADAQAAEAATVQVPTADISSAQARSDVAAGEGFDRARTAAEQIPDPRLRASALAGVARAEAEYAAAREEAKAAVAQFNAGIGSVAEALGSLSQAQRVQTRAAVTAAQRVVDALTVRAPIPGVVVLGSGGDAATTGGLGEAVGQLPPGAQQQATQLFGTDGGSRTEATIVEGAPVDTGDTLLRVTDVSSLALTAEVDETDVLLVRPGVRAEAELDAVAGARYAATVTSVDVAPTPSSGGGVTYVVRLALGAGQTADGEPAPVPRPGMSAVVDLRVRAARDAVSVPAGAIVRSGTRDAVYVVRAGRAAQRTVRLGAQGEDRVQVLAGLREGERVVVRGADQVREGQEVE
jgi:HlyD family secretion protein